MILHVGERVFWGAVEVIYLEGIIISLNEKEQSVVVHIDRATPNSAHLIGSDVPFAANGVTYLKGDSPSGTTNEYHAERQPLHEMSDDEKLRRAAAVVVHQQYGYTLPEERENDLVEQVIQTLNNDPEMRTKIIESMNEILKRGI